MAVKMYHAKLGMKVWTERPAEELLKEGWSFTPIEKKEETKIEAPKEAEKVKDHSFTEHPEQKRGPGRPKINH